MSKQRALDRIADELYALHPDAFAAARDERVKQARAEGNKALARDLAGLRRPTLSAWLVNLLWRDQGAVVDQLIEVAEAMAHAQARGSGTALRTLMGQRREIEAALLRRANALAEEAGVKVTPAMAREAQDTLAAAMARPDVAAEVRSGRLVKPAAYAGFGDLVMAMPTVPSPKQAAPARSDELAERRAVAERTAAEPAAGESTDSGGDESTTPRRSPGPLAASSHPPALGRAVAGGPTPTKGERAAAERAAAERAARRAEAEARIDEARVAVEMAAAALTAETRVAEAAHEQHKQLVGQLRALEMQAAAADAAARAADQRRSAAAKAHDAARRTLERAEQDAEATAT